MIAIEYIEPYETTITTDLTVSNIRFSEETVRYEVIVELFEDDEEDFEVPESIEIIGIVVEKIQNIRINQYNIRTWMN